MASVPPSPTPAPRPAAASASLVIAPQWIGDAVMTEPLMRRLHARGERLTVGALPWVAPVYRAMPQVAEVIEFPFAHGGLQFKARRSLARELTGRFDSAYVLPNSLKSALLPFLASIPRRVGYLGEARVGLLTHRLKNPAGKPPMVAFYSALSGEPGVAQDRPRLQLADATVDAVLAAHGLARGGYTVMAPGAEFGPAKRWPTRHFARLASLLGQTVVLLGSAKEAPLCAEIVEAMRGEQDARAEGMAAAGIPLGSSTGVQAAQAAAHSGVEQGTSGPGAAPVAVPPLLDLSGRTSLADALALIAGSARMVSNDSGLMHVAAAFGVPQAAVFGSSSPHHTPPLNERARVLWLKDDPGYQPPLDCAPCFQRECPLGHTRCLNDLSPERVRDALRA